MSNTSILKVSLSAFCGALATFWHMYSAIVILVLVSIALDVVTGIVKACATGEALNSDTARKGFWLKVSELMALSFGMFIDYLLPTLAETIDLNIKFRSPIGLIIGCYIILNECISIVGNITKANPHILPKWVKQFFTDSKKNIDKIGGGK